MRTKEDIVTDLKKTAQYQFATYHNGPPPEIITIELLIDIREILNSLLKRHRNQLFDHAKET